MTKQLLKSHAKSQALLLVPEDENRKPKRKKGKKESKLRTIGDYYVATNGHVLIRLHHEQISDKAWDWFESDAASGYRHPHSHLGSKLKLLMPDWFSILVPQAGGILKRVKLIAEPKGIMLSKVARLSVFSYGKLDFTVPARQLELVRRLHPTVKFYMGPTLYGTTVFGDPVTHHCPLVCKTKDAGPIALIMPMRDRMV